MGRISIKDGAGRVIKVLDSFEEAEEWDREQVRLEKIESKGMWKVWLVIIACVLFVAVILFLLPVPAHGQGGVLDALPDDVTLRQVYRIYRGEYTNVSIAMAPDAAAALLFVVRNAPKVSVANSNATTGYWEVWQNDMWRPFPTQYTFSMDFGDYRVWLAPAPGGTLVAVSQPRPSERIYGDWHCASAFVVENTAELLAIINGG